MPRVALSFCLLTLGACAAAGGPAPTELYDALTDGDLALAVGTMQQALEHEGNGRRLSWSNAETGNSGSVTPLKTYITTGGYPCRSYAEELRIAGRAGSFENTACRNDAGSWIWID